MAGFGNAFGGLAGGLAQGYSMGHEMQRRNAEDRRRQEDHQYQQEQRELDKQIREGTGAYIATEGLNVPTDYQMQPGASGNLDSGDVYSPVMQKQTQQGAWKAASQHAARLGADPTRVAQIEQTGLGLAGKRRDEKYAQREESVDDFLAKIQGLPDDQRLTRMAQFASSWGDDGKSFGVEPDPQGGYRLVMTADGQARSKTFKDLAEVEQRLRMYASPKYRKEGDELGLKQRQVGAQETQAKAMEQYRKDQGPVLTAQAGAHNAHAGLYKAMEEYYKKGGPAQGRGSAFERLPEGDKILLQSRERQEQAIVTALGKVEQGQEGPLMQQLQMLRREQFDHLKKLKLLPDGVTKTQYLGLPDPLEMAKQAMSGARGEREFRASMEQFEQLYGDAPEAAQAFNAMQVFMQNQYYDRVKPQNTPGLRTSSSPRLPVGQYYQGQGNFASGLVAPNAQPR